MSAAVVLTAVFLGVAIAALVGAVANEIRICRQQMEGEEAEKRL